MLFSQPRLAARMNRDFECAWESVRPVPRVTIDFGNGRVLERTLHGNVATYLCTSEGEVVDVVPGLVDAREYEQALERALAGLGRPAGARARPPVREREELRAFVQGWHAERIASAREERALAFPPLAGDASNLSKFRVEAPIEDVLDPGLALADAGALARDTRFNREVRYPLVSELLLERPLARPSELTRDVFARVLRVDLDDPYLGLAPDVLGGEPGRH